MDEVFPLGSAIDFVNSVNLGNQAVAMLGSTQMAGIRVKCSMAIGTTSSSKTTLE